MPHHIYPRLIVLTAGTLLPFFWMVVILGHRRQTKFRAHFFLSCACHWFSFSGFPVSAQRPALLHEIPRHSGSFCLDGGLPGVVVLTVVVDASACRICRRPSADCFREARKGCGLRQPTLLRVLLLPYFYAALRLRAGWTSICPATRWASPSKFGSSSQLCSAAGWQWTISEGRARQGAKIASTGHCTSISSCLALLVIRWSCAPMAIAGNAESRRILRMAHRCHCAGPAGYSRSGMFRNSISCRSAGSEILFMRYLRRFWRCFILSLIRRASLWMEPYLPPEASAAILLFLPVVFFEPLQRLMRRILRRTAQMEMDHAQRMMAPIQEVARLGNLAEADGFYREVGRGRVATR